MISWAAARSEVLLLREMPSFAHEIYHCKNLRARRGQEIMYLHVNLKTRRVAPFSMTFRAGIAEAAKAHEQLPVPEWCGCRIVSARTPSTPRFQRASAPE